MLTFNQATEEAQKYNKRHAFKALFEAENEDIDLENIFFLDVKDG